MAILVIDDDAGIRDLLTIFLAHKGYSATSAGNGAEGLDYLQRQHELPDLVLLDLMMPIMDGAEFRHAQQADLRLANIPVVVMSAAENIQAQAPTLTADAYLPKPIDFDGLLQIVERYCAQSLQHGS